MRQPQSAVSKNRVAVLVNQKIKFGMASGLSQQGVVIYVPCRRVCDRDQNWIKWLKPFLRADQEIKVTSKLRKSKDQECVAPIRPLTHKKSSDHELLKGQSSDQLHFLPMIATLQQVTYNWLPLTFENLCRHCRWWQRCSTFILYSSRGFVTWKTQHYLC